MTTINSILTEWTYRLESGYPKNEQDYDILREVLDEMTDLPPAKKDDIVRRAKGLAEQEDDVEISDTEQIASTLTEIGLPEDLVNQVIVKYNELPDSKKENFKSNFRSHSIESYVQSGWKPFKDFFMVNIGGARGGMGNGEVPILLAVKDSKPGGTAQHDIVMSNGEWEVKEIKSGKFDPAKSGLVSKFELTSKIKNFYEEIVNPLSSIGDPYEALKHLVPPTTADKLKKLIMIFETRFIESIDSDKLASFEWKKSAMYNWYEGFKDLNRIFYDTDLDTSIRDTRITVNKNGEANSFWISDEDVEEIERSAGTNDDTADIWVGDPVDNANTNAVIWIKRIQRNEFIKNPDTFIMHLNRVKNSFFNELLGLIWYNYRDPQPHIGLPGDFAIDSVSQGRYRFVLKDIPSTKGYEYIEKQS